MTEQNASRSEGENETGAWLRAARTVYALQHAGWRQGVEQFCNRWSVHVQGGPGSTPEELERIAKLIAAAPALLAALLALRDAVKDHPDFQAQKYDGLGIQVSAAIARATGA